MLRCWEKLIIILKFLIICVSVKTGQNNYKIYKVAILSCCNDTNIMISFLKQI